MDDIINEEEMDELVTTHRQMWPDDEATDKELRKEFILITYPTL